MHYTSPPLLEPRRTMVCESSDLDRKLTISNPWLYSNSYVGLVFKNALCGFLFVQKRSMRVRNSDVSISGWYIDINVALGRFTLEAFLMLPRHYKWYLGTLLHDS
jgi:hypothetical protein